MRPKIPIPSTSNRELKVVDRVLQTVLGIVILSAIYRYCWLDVTDPYKCGALLNKGRWLDPGPQWSTSNPFQNWQPPGCILHDYKKKDIQECLHEQRLVLVGDSTTRQIFWAVTKKMDQRKAEAEITDMLESNEKHVDLEFNSGGVSVQFIWDPYLNSTRLDRELKTFKPDPYVESGHAGESAGLILLGSPGLWYARHGGRNFMRDFKESIDHVIPFMDHAKEENMVLPVSRPFPSRKQSPNFLLLAPIQVPRYQSLSPSREETITPEKIDTMNNYLQQVSERSSADVVWSYSLMTWEGKAEYEESGLHVVNNVARQKADILLNLRCNADGRSLGHPFNRTCCSNYEQPALAQWVILLGGLFVLPALPFIRRKHVLQLGRLFPSPEIMNAMIVFGLVVCYCFYTDRTQIFAKEHKQFRINEFLWACGVVAFAGLASVWGSKAPTTDHKEAVHIKDQGFLSRDQSDEWKGWMQFALLIYHYTHGSKILWMYEIVRLLVASYLFMTGYGHTLYFLTKEDYSLKRVASVLVRLNLLSCALPYMMRSNYAFYYFAPLVSFWFLVIYFTLKIGREYNSNLNFLVGKIVLSGLLTTAFTLIPRVLETVSLLLKLTCAISWDITEWRFRASLDMYVVYIGMLLAAAYLRTCRLRSSTTAPRSIIDQILQLTITHHIIFKALLIIAAVALPPSFWALTRRSPDKQDYNWWHPFISFIPILCFVALRNSHRVLRNHHSTLFAWLGRCSLETYVLQYHIWLAGDTTGLLRIGLWSRSTEVILLTPIFIWASWKMTRACQVLTAWIIYGSSPRGSWESSEAGQMDSPYLLPDLRNGGLMEREGVSRAEIGTGQIARLVRKLREDLKWRLGFIMMMMWVGNVTYN